MTAPSDEKVQLVMSHLPPEARTALNVMAKMQSRDPEDVLRDEIQKYIQGKVPAINLEGITQGIKDQAFTAGYLVGRLRNFARRMGSE